MTQQITIDYLKRLGACWSDERLTEAAQAWPATPTWAWFLGERLRMLERDAVIERLSVAIAHTRLQRLRVPGLDRIGRLMRLAEACSSERLEQLCAAFGSYLDRQGEPERIAIEEALAAARVSEQTPSMDAADSQPEG